MCIGKLDSQERYKFPWHLSFWLLTQAPKGVRNNTGPE